jgi:pyruvate ferredoxin oxidoreductase beta subunit
MSVAVERPKEAYLNVFAYRMAPREEYFTRGHRACQGCAAALGLRHIMKAAGRDTIVVNATGCMEIISSPYPYTSWAVPWIHVAFENAAAVASGIDAAIKALHRKGRIPRKKVNILAIAGDGGTADIGLQALSGMLARGHNVTYICYDNEAYMNTGVQGSSATPMGASTTTTPAGKVSFGAGYWKKNVAAIAAAHDIPYVATACPSYPLDLIRKVKRSFELDGPAYIHLFAVCPTGWGNPPDLSISLGRLAVETGIFPLYEVEYGCYKLTMDFPKGLRPVEDYFKKQRRFRHLTPEVIGQIQERVSREYERLEKMEKVTQE